MTSLLIPSFFLWVFSLFNQFGIKPRFGMSQLGYVVAGTFAFFIIKRIGRRFFIANIQTIFWSFFVILIITFLIGLEVKGSKRWIDFGIVNFQASEFLKIFYIMYIAKLLSDKSRSEMTPFFYIKLLFISLLPAFIVLRQPDLGNASVFLGVLVIMLFVSDIPKQYLLISGIILFILLPFSWFFLHDYQQARIVSFIQPHSDSQGDAYNMIQAIITVGSGQFLGKGLGLGKQREILWRA